MSLPVELAATTDGCAGNFRMATVPVIGRRVVSHVASDAEIGLSA
jgi:hypothetical protein